MFALILFLPASPALASGKKDEKTEEEPKTPDKINEVRCEAEVFYIWKTMDNGNKKGESKEVFVLRFGETADSMEKAKRSLAAKSSTEKHRALTKCEEKHQSSHRCIAKKMQSLSDEYGTFDFAARSALLESIKADCQALLGECLSARVSDASCHEIETPMPEAEAAPEEEEEAKGKKKKKKK